MSLKIKVRFFDYQNAQKFDIDSNSKICYGSSSISVKYAIIGSKERTMNFA